MSEGYNAPETDRGGAGFSALPWQTLQPGNW